MRTDLSFSFLNPGLDPGITRMTNPFTRYDTAMSWGGRKFRYDRTRSCVLACTPEQHAVLHKMLNVASNASNYTFAFVDGKVREGGAVVKMLEPALVRAHMQDVTDRLLASGYPRDSLNHVAGSRAAAHTMQACGVYLKLGRPPMLKYATSGDAVYALPIRVARGHMYGRPIGVIPAEGGAWLSLDLREYGPDEKSEMLWATELPECPTGKTLDMATYCEFTFWSQSWRLRFVFGSELTAEALADAKRRKEIRASNARILAGR